MSPDRLDVKTDHHSNEKYCQKIGRPDDEVCGSKKNLNIKDVKTFHFRFLFQHFESFDFYLGKSIQIMNDDD